MPDGGVFVLTIPPAAYRCQPGPYERACQVAWYLKTTRPRAKLIVLDANPNIVSKTGLFRAAWRAYPNLEYRGSARVVKATYFAREVGLKRLSRSPRGTPCQGMTMDQPSTQRSR